MILNDAINMKIGRTQVHKMYMGNDLVWKRYGEIKMENLQWYAKVIDGHNCYYANLPSDAKSPTSEGNFGSCVGYTLYQSSNYSKFLSQDKLLYVSSSRMSGINRVFITDWDCSTVSDFVTSVTGKRLYYALA